MKSAVILNMIDYPLNGAQYAVSAEEEAAIREIGIWSEPGERILEHINWSACQETLYDLFDEQTDMI